MSGAARRPRRFELRSASGVAATLTDAGAALVSLRAPDRAGRPAETLLGFDAAETYLEPGPYLGVSVGRVANRIARARFVLDGREHLLAANEGPNHLHGGAHGFSRRLWDATAIDGGVRFDRESPEGEEGYPGTLRASVSFRLAEDGALRVEFRATTDAPTLFAPTLHPYFNLHDAGAGTIEEHRLEVCADAYTPVDDTGIPTGEIRPVADSPFDLRAARRLSDVHAALAPGRGGLDHNFVLRGGGGRLRPAARLHDPASGRTLEVETTFPGLQVYSAGGLDGSLAGRGGLRYPRFAGVALEAQYFPDAPHHPAFPSIVLRPGGTFAETTVYRLVARGSRSSPGSGS